MRKLFWTLVAALLPFTACDPTLDIDDTTDATTGASIPSSENSSSAVLPCTIFQ